MNCRLRFFICCFCVFLSATSEASLIDDIKNANTEFMAAFDGDDLTKLSELYTEDCKVMPTGSDVMSGREAVKDVFGSVKKAGVKTVKLDVDEVGPLGNSSNGTTMAFERSHYTFFKEKNEVFDAGKYVVIWKLMNRQWFLYIDIFNTDMSLDLK